MSQAAGLEYRCEMYVDGACLGNPGPGGWGVHAEINGKIKEWSGAEADTTNNRMEMMAAISALEEIPVGSTVTMYSDSQYVTKGISEWLPKWKKNSWKTANGTPVKNQDLWRRLDKAAHCHNVNWRWVRGHAGNPGNERADQLANEACGRASGVRS